MREKMRRWYGWIMLMLMFISVPFQSDEKTIKVKKKDADNIARRQKVLWSLRMCPGRKVICSKNRKYVEKAEQYIKALGSSNRKKVEIAFHKFRKIAPYILPYIKKRYKTLKTHQHLVAILLRIYSRPFNEKINLKIMCEDRKGGFLWYGVVLKEDNYGLILVGDQQGVIDSIPVRTIEKWNINKYSCELKNENRKGYAIEIEIGKGYSFVATDSKFYFASKIVTDARKNSYSIISKVSSHNITGKWMVNPDTQRYGFRAHKGNKMVVIIDGKESKEYDNVEDLIFSSDGQRYGFIAQEGKKWVAVIDGVEGKKYDKIEGLKFSPDGQRYGFIAQEGKKWVAVIDGVESKKYDGIKHESFNRGVVFSYDGKKYGFIGRRKDKWVAVINGKESKKYNDVQNLTISANGQRYGFFAFKENNVIVSVIDDKETKRYAAGVHLTFSPDAKRYGFITWKRTQGENKWIAVIDGKESREYDRILDFQFSPGTQRYGFIAQKGRKWVAVIDGEESREYDFIYVFSLIFSSDGRRYGYVAADAGGKLVVVDGKESKIYSDIKLIIDDPDNLYLKWSLDNKLFAFIAKSIKEGEERCEIVVDGYTIDNLQCTPDFYFYKNTLKFIEFRNNKIYKVICK